MELNVDPLASTFDQRISHRNSAWLGFEFLSLRSQMSKYVYFSKYIGISDWNEGMFECLCKSNARAIEYLNCIQKFGWESNRSKLSPGDHKLRHHQPCRSEPKVGDQSAIGRSWCQISPAHLICGRFASLMDGILLRFLIEVSPYTAAAAAPTAAAALFAAKATFAANPPSFTAVCAPRIIFAALPKPFRPFQIHCTFLYDYGNVRRLECN
jgi:hypothetical protein